MKHQQKSLSSHDLFSTEEETAFINNKFASGFHPRIKPNWFHEKYVCHKVAKTHTVVAKCLRLQLTISKISWTRFKIHVQLQWLCRALLNREASLPSSDEHGVLVLYISQSYQNQKIRTSTWNWWTGRASKNSWATKKQLPPCRGTSWTALYHDTGIPVWLTHLL